MRLDPVGLGTSHGSSPSLRLRSIAFVLLVMLGCSEKDDPKTQAANNRARLEVMAEAEYEVVARAVASGSLGPRDEVVAVMTQSAEESASGDNVGVEPFRFFTADGGLVPYSEMSTRQRLAYNLWLNRFVVGAAIRAEMKLARDGAETRWREQQENEG